MRIATLAAAALLVAACGGKHEQTFAEGLELACSAPDLVHDGEPAARIAPGLKLVQDKIVNPEARALLGSLADAPDKMGTLRAAVQKAGLARCALLEIWQAEWGKAHTGSL